MVSDGPRKVYREVPWLETQKFFRVSDTLTDEVFYCTTTEARVRVALSVDGFRSAVKNKRLIKNRYLAENIPRFLFIKNTGRHHDERWDFYYKW